MDIKTIKQALTEYKRPEVEVYTNYLTKLLIEKNSNKQLKNPWMAYKKDNDFIGYFKQVALDGLAIDGVHITITSIGVSYNYIAHKNKLLLIYPEALFDFGIVFKNDAFKFQKQSGKVIYSHDINDPFNQDEKNIVGAYAVITTKRGQFLTLLSKDNIDKCRKVAKTDTIWKQWYLQMCLKTVIKNAIKIHFSDIYQNIATLDNENYDLELPLDIDINIKAAIEKIDTLDGLTKYYNKNKGKNAGVMESFVKLLAKRRAEVIEENKKKAEAENREPADDSVREPGEEG